VRNRDYQREVESLLKKTFVPVGYQITNNVELDPVPESAKYEALNFSLNNKRIVYRKAKVTLDRPGAFLAVWQRPKSGGITGNKPIPLTTSQLDYLFIQVESDDSISKEHRQGASSGLFIFPVSLLIDKGVISTAKKKGKTGFRVFPPWSQDRGSAGTKVFSESGKKTQRWQMPFFLAVDDKGLIDSYTLRKLLDNK
jgi:hypothetical protein